MSPDFRRFLAGAVVAGLAIAADAARKFRNALRELGR